MAAGAVTAIVNAGSETFDVPLLALMTMFEYLPSSAAVGVPASIPVVALKVVQLGALRIENVSFLEAGSVAVG